MLIVLIIALLFSLEAEHLDFDTAFLISEMDGAIIYIEQPEQFDDDTGRVCLLLKGIYGLKQAARLWYQTLNAYLVELCFCRCVFDVGLYYKWIEDRIVIITVYVDDKMIIGTREDIDQVKKMLRARFSIKDLGRVHYLLGMEVHYEPGVLLCLTQTAYIDKILSRFKMDKAKSVKSPQMQNEKYQELIGALQYLVTCTQPDISNAVRNLSRYTGSYTKDNYVAPKRVLRYLQ
ncbi:Uncharacterized protein PHPALM_13866 [Phytophthora palmivora]|uniref:Reverse transcriptase Ty1/copia-type domain-containing protein n=1 Tax=Phytophthora palmivora TaxID=4796 RepID=A0A2P4XW78_9STRA|nr:Uncharacterized protein PHPALM_13866 [Phytophthora palmivora]